MRHPPGKSQQLLAGRLGSGDAVHMTPQELKQCAWLERLDQIIDSALAHRIHRPRYRAKGGHQQHGHLRVALPNQREQFVAVHAGHVHVTDDQAE